MSQNTTQVVRFQFKVDIASNWTKYNPRLLKNEFGFEYDSNNETKICKFKIGDGVKSWNDLPYASAGLDDNTIHVDENGNAWFAKDVYVGGFQQNEGKKLATEEFIESKLDMKANIDRVQIIESQILNIDYNTILAFDTSEIVFDAGTNTTSVLGQASLGQMILA